MTREELSRKYWRYYSMLENKFIETTAYGYHFPLRNRLIAALSDELAVMDPGKRSGAMITLEYADRMGKPVRIYR